MKQIIKHLRELEAATSDCYPEVMGLVREVRATLPVLLDQLEKLEAVAEAAAAWYAAWDSDNGFRVEREALRDALATLKDSK